MASRVLTRRDLVKHVIESGQLPTTSKMGAFRDVCNNWVEEKFPDDTAEDKHKFLESFRVSLSKKYKGNPQRLLEVWSLTRILKLSCSKMSLAGVACPIS